MQRLGTQAARPHQDVEDAIDRDELIMLGEDLRNILTVLRACAGECAGAWLRADRIARRLISPHTLSQRSPQPIDVDLVVSLFHGMVALVVGDRIRVTLDLAPSPKHVMAEREEIERILLNLAAYAHEAMPDGGTLTIRTAGGKEVPPGLRVPYVRAKSFVRLSVADTSIGMPSGMRHRVLSLAPLPTEQGTQLTLAAVAHTVRRLGGTLHIEADDGQGTRVVIDLPGVEGDDRE